MLIKASAIVAIAGIVAEALLIPTFNLSSSESKTYQPVAYIPVILYSEPDHTHEPQKTTSSSISLPLPTYSGTSFESHHKRHEPSNHIESTSTFTTGVIPKASLISYHKRAQPTAAFEVDHFNFTVINTSSETHYQERHEPTNHVESTSTFTTKVIQKASQTSDQKLAEPSAVVEVDSVSYNYTVLGTALHTRMNITKSANFSSNSTSVIAKRDSHKFFQWLSWLRPIRIPYISEQWKYDWERNDENGVKIIEKNHTMVIEKNHTKIAKRGKGRHPIAAIVDVIRLNETKAIAANATESNTTSADSDSISDIKKQDRIYYPPSSTSSTFKPDETYRFRRFPYPYDPRVPMPASLLSKRDEAPSITQPVISFPSEPRNPEWNVIPPTTITVTRKSEPTSPSQPPTNVNSHPTSTQCIRTVTQFHPLHAVTDGTFTHYKEHVTSTRFIDCKGCKLATRWKFDDHNKDHFSGIATATVTLPATTAHVKACKTSGQWWPYKEVRTI